MVPDSHSQLPGYVVNVPMVVHSDEEGSSSDEELDGNFDQDCFDDPTEYIRLHPLKNNSKPLRGRILEATTLEFPNLPPSKKIESFWNKFQDENRLMGGTLLHRIRVVVGLNKMRSLSRSRNQALFNELNCSNGKTLIRKIGFLWDGRWEKKVGKEWVEVTYDYARKFYKQLKKIDPDKAEEYRNATEGAEVYRKNPNVLKKVKLQQIPYREIRDTIKNHSATRKATEELRAQNINNIFLFFQDGDLISFRSPRSKGPFATIDALSRNLNLQVISTGYEIREPENRALEIAVLADLCVRKATTEFIKNGVYYPEPCAAVKIRNEFDTVTEDFSDGTCIYGSPKEMPLLIEKVIRARDLNPQTSMEFDTHGSLITETPNRMRRSITSQINNKGKLISWGLSDLETMRGINQSHYNSRNWAKYLLLGLKLKGTVTLFGVTLQDKNSISECAISLLSRVFNAYDPVEKAKGDSFQQDFISILKEPDKHTFGSIQSTTIKRNHKRQNREDKEKLWKELDAIDSHQKMQDAMQKILKRPGYFSSIYTAAQKINKDLIKLFKETLCLDFEEVIQSTLEDLVEFYEPSEVFNQIIRGEKFLKKDILCVESLTPLHIAAIAGNKGAISQLIIWKQDLSKKDTKGRYPFEYGLIYCKNNGLDLELLDALWCDDVLDEASKLVYKHLSTISEQMAVSEFLIEKHGVTATREYNKTLFFEAVYQEKNQLATRLAELSTQISRDIAEEMITKAPNWNVLLRPLLKYTDTERLYDNLSEQNKRHFDEFYRLHDPHEFNHFIIKNIDTEGINQNELEKEFFKAVYEKDETKIEEFAHRNDFSIPIAIQHELVRAEVWKDELISLVRNNLHSLNFDSIKLALGEKLYDSLKDLLKKYIYFSSDYDDIDYDDDYIETLPSPTNSDSSFLYDFECPDSPVDPTLEDMHRSDSDVEMDEFNE